MNPKCLPWQEELEPVTEPMSAGTFCPVSVDNEWDSLEEVIVGSAEGARVPDWHPCVEAVIPRRYHNFFRQNSGKQFPSIEIGNAQKELDHLARFLELQGITVRRPSELPLSAPVSTPYFNTLGGMYHAMPRDSVLIVGNKIIEAPMAWRSRYFEACSLREVFKDYFMQGALWTAAPKPTLADAAYCPDALASSFGERFVISEFEPLFDAADFLRIGNQLVGQLSHVTNWFGIQWLRRELGPNYKVRVYRFGEPDPMHIDTTIMPLGPGKLLVNPIWVQELPDCFKDWEILVAPRPTDSSGHSLFFSSSWLSMNLLMLDERHVLVEESDSEMVSALKGWGFEPIPLPFKHVQSFGGSFHCATLDVRRHNPSNNQRMND